MKKFLLVSLCLVMILGVAESFDYVEKELQSEEGLQGLYTRWKAHHKVQRQSPERFNVFKYNVARVHTSNSVKKSFKLELNHFADLTDHEIQRMYTSNIQHHVQLQGSLPFNYSTLVKGAAPSAELKSGGDFPKEFDWRNWNGQNFVHPVKNQGQCGSCWAFSAVAAVESVNAMRQHMIELSEQQLLDCDTNGRNNACDGGLFCEAFKFIKDHGGLASASSYPYVGKREVCCQAKFGHHAVVIDGMRHVPNNNEEELMRAVMKQPVTIVMDASNEFMFYKEGVFTGQCGTTYNHGMLLTGFGETPEGQKFWNCKNSWGEGWGEQGYVRMVRGEDTTIGKCAMYAYSTYPLKCTHTPNIEL